MMFLGASGFPVVLTDEWIHIFEGVANDSTTKHQLVDLIVGRLLGGRDVPIEYEVSSTTAQARGVSSPASAALPSFSLRVLARDRHGLPRRCAVTWMYAG